MAPKTSSGFTARAVSFIRVSGKAFALWIASFPVADPTFWREVSLQLQREHELRELELKLQTALAGSGGLGIVAAHNGYLNSKRFDAQMRWASKVLAASNAVDSHEVFRDYAQVMSRFRSELEQAVRDRGAKKRSAGDVAKDTALLPKGIGLEVLYQQAQQAP